MPGAHRRCPGGPRLAESVLAMATRALRRAGLLALVLGTTGLALGTPCRTARATGPADGSVATPAPSPAPPIDGIPCAEGQRQAMHIHVHLAVYVRGVERPVPAGIGVAGATVRRTSQGPLVVGALCFYWLHTHAADGIIHAEAPRPRSFTLGEFFDIWGMALSSHRVGDARGPVTTYLGGQRFTSSPRTLRLVDRAVIQLDVGANTPPQPYWFGFTPGPIAAAGAASAGVVAVAALATRWSWLLRLLATSLTFLLVAAWRTACGLLGVDAAGPLGDVVLAGGSAVAGGLGAAVVAARDGPGGMTRWLPALMGAATGGLAGVLG
jgi:uncharacterized protein YjeT (DUF2065 family)